MGGGCNGGYLLFGPLKINTKQTFYRSKYAYASVNLKPIVPGHSLVIPFRRVTRFIEMSKEEVNDIWQSAKMIGIELQKHYNCTSLTFSMQDGPAAGQTVPHVHIHVLPRKEGDFKWKDDVYKEMELEEMRRPRSREEMEQEASLLSTLFPDNQPIYSEEELNQIQSQNLLN